MSMLTTVEDGIVSLAGTTTFTLTGGQSGYAKIQPGALKDVTDLIPCFTIDILKSSSTHNGSGGTIGWKIRELHTFRGMSYVDYSDAATAEKDILIIRDAIIPIFQQSVRLGNLAVGGTLPDVPNVYASLVQENSEQYFYRDMFNGVIYRAHMFLLSVRCEYTLVLAQ